MGNGESPAEGESYAGGRVMLFGWPYDFWSSWNRGERGQDRSGQSGARARLLVGVLLKCLPIKFLLGVSWACVA